MPRELILNHSLIMENMKYRQGLFGRFHFIKNDPVLFHAMY